MKIFSYGGLFVALLMLGCGAGANLPEGETGTVEGVLTLDGAAAPEGSSVVFIPQSGEVPASGTVDASGSFTMKSRGESKILAGTYNVGVTPPPAPEMTAEQQMAINLGQAEFQEYKHDIPEKYLNPQSSGETFTVKGGSNTLNLDMKKE